ncbi:MAG: hypothetical protein WB622_14475 [Acidobacteriaceae bacterium]
MSATITFDEMERSADRTLAVALWARHVRGWISGIVFFAALHAALRGLLRSLSADTRLAALTDSQATELTARLREIHENLSHVLDHHGMRVLRTKPVFSMLISSLEEDTEDLYDIIENLVLAGDKEFRSLISDCIRHLPSAEPVGRL